MNDPVVLTGRNIDAALVAAYQHEKRALRVRATIVTVFDELPERLALLEGAVAWREMFSYGEHQDLWRSAYRLREVFAASTEPAVRDVATWFHHASAAIVMRAVVVDTLKKKAPAPDLLVVQSHDATPFRNVALRTRRVRTALPFSRVFGRNPSASAEPSAATSALLDPEEGAPAAFFVEDSGSGINLNPSLKVLPELRRLGLEATILTTSANCQRILAEHGFGARLCAPSGAKKGVAAILAEAWRWRRAFAREARRYPDGSLEALALGVLRSNLLHLAAQKYIIRAGLSSAYRSCNPRLVYLANESAPCAGLVKAWAGERNVRVVGFNPVLMGRRPDNSYYPADEHLVYGDQLKDLMVTCAVPEARIKVVGSPTFDGINPTRVAAQSAAPEVGWPPGLKRVVIGTEAFPRPMDELAPVLEALANRPDTHVVIKVHPADSLEFFREVAAKLAFKGGVEVVKSCDLNGLLKSADLLVCLISNIIVTAAILGTPTLVCDFSDKREPLDFVAEGLCYGCFDRTKVGETLELLLSNPRLKEDWRASKAPALRRFNGPNDGRSHLRIAEYIMDGSKPSTYI